MLYAVTWRNGRSRVAAGSLELGGEKLRLRGGRSLDVAYEQIVGTHVGRGVADRVAGRQTLVLELTGGDVVRIASMHGPGTLTELVERVEAVIRRHAPGS